MTVYLATGLLSAVARNLPGRVELGISGKHSLANLSPSWIQAHGHAQIFGWLGTLIIGIGYYSLECAKCREGRCAERTSENALSEISLGASAPDDKS